MHPLQPIMYNFALRTADFALVTDFALRTADFPLVTDFALLTTDFGLYFACNTYFRVIFGVLFVLLKFPQKNCPTNGNFCRLVC